MNRLCHRFDRLINNNVRSGASRRTSWWSQRFSFSTTTTTTPSSTTETTTTSSDSIATVSTPDTPLPNDIQQKYWIPHSNNQTAPSGRYQRPIFIAATRQHVGKTTVSLALVSGLKKRFDKVGFIKPVGQQHVAVHSENLAQDIRVDKDVMLLRERFHLHHVDYEHMSPVIIPRGYTRRYVDGEISHEKQLQDIEQSMMQITKNSNVVLLEGTGHCAVGSIVNANNAKVASMLGADMILIANGGLGSAFDELELNRVLCQHYNVRIAGVIINKVLNEKYEQTQHYLAKALKRAWGIPLLACIPDRPFLGCPALADLESLFETKMLTGMEHRYRHYSVRDMTVVTTSLTQFMTTIRKKPHRTLYICHVTRDDLILGFMGEYQRRRKEGKPFEEALIICGRKDRYQLSSRIHDLMDGLDGCCMMEANMSTHRAMDAIQSFTPKLNIHDTNRVSVAIEHYEPYIDFDELLRRTTSSNSSFNDPAGISFEELRRL